MVKIMTKKIVVINGAGGVGKDQFCNYCDLYVPTYVISTVDKVKEAYRLLGWNNEKSELHRKALSDIKDIGTKNLDHPYTFIKAQIELFNSSDHDLMFVHTREPDEIERFAKEFGCITLLIKNPRIKSITSNHADAEVENYNYDYIIDNDGTLDELNIKAKEFIKEMFNGQ